MLPRRENGFAFILALAFLVLMLALGIIIAQMSTQHLRSVAQRRDFLVASYLAEAGAEKALWRLQQSGGSQYRGENFRLSRPDGTPLGEVAVQVEPDASSPFPNALLITSWGYLLSASSPRPSSRVRLHLHYLPAQTNWHVAFDYAVFTKGMQDYRGGGSPSEAIVNDGSVHSNLRITINNPSHRIVEPGYRVEAPNWPDYPGDVDFPLLDLNYYRALAIAQGRYYNGTTNIQLPNGPGQVTFAEGLSPSQTVRFQGNRRGRGMLILVGGNLVLGGNVVFEGVIYLVSPNLEGWSPGQGSNVDLNGGAAVYGNIVALELVTSSGTPRVYYDRSKIDTIRLDERSASIRLFLDGWER